MQSLRAVISRQRMSSRAWSYDTSSSVYVSTSSKTYMHGHSKSDEVFCWQQFSFGILQHLIPLHIKIVVNGVRKCVAYEFVVMLVKRIDVRYVFA